MWQLRHLLFPAFTPQRLGDAMCAAASYYFLNRLMLLLHLIFAFHHMHPSHHPERHLNANRKRKIDQTAGAAARCTSLPSFDPPTSSMTDCSFQRDPLASHLVGTSATSDYARDLFSICSLESSARFSGQKTCPFASHLKTSPCHARHPWIHSEPVPGPSIYNCPRPAGSFPCRRQRFRVCMVMFMAS
ncbi:hypothetical protein DFH09DRAFT_1138236 [Mycena vulgaris]|nr:hypothetical protein DFH09DRAFT_1138236 [Mycena vulgaris]